MTISIKPFWDKRLIVKFTKDLEQQKAIDVMCHDWFAKYLYTGQNDRLAEKQNEK